MCKNIQENFVMAERYNKKTSDMKATSDDKAQLHYKTLIVIFVFWLMYYLPLISQHQ
jgi:hypothetical protein